MEGLKFVTQGCVHDLQMPEGRKRSLTALSKWDDRPSMSRGKQRMTGHVWPRHAATHHWRRSEQEDDSEPKRLDTRKQAIFLCKMVGSISWGMGSVPWLNQS